MFTFATFVIFALGIASGQRLGTCGKDRSTAFDSCANKLFIIGDSEARFPTNLREAHKWCSDSKASVKCVKDFSKECLHALARQVNNLLAYGANKHQKKVCRSIQTRTEAFSKLRCLNKNYFQLNEEMHKLVDNFQRLVGSKSDEKIPGLCCKFYAFRTAANREASKVCSPDDTKYFDEYISSFARDIMDLLCTNYGENSERCESLSLPPHDGKTKRTKSPMPPLLLAMSSI